MVVVVIAFKVTGGNRSGISTQGLQHTVSSVHTLPALTSLGCEAPCTGRVKRQILLSQVGQAVAPFSHKGLGRTHTAAFRFMASILLKQAGPG